MIQAEAHSIPVEDNSYEITFARHLLEHQPTFEPILDEMIRIGSKLTAHIWFKKPGDIEVIDYNSINKLYHNIFSKKKINDYLFNHPKVKYNEWIDIDETESLLLIWLKI